MRQELFGHCHYQLRTLQIKHIFNTVVNSKGLHGDLHNLRTYSFPDDQCVFGQLTITCVINHIYNFIVRVSSNEFFFTHITGITNDARITAGYIFTINYCPLMLFKNKKIGSKRIKIIIKVLYDWYSVINLRSLI